MAGIATTVWEVRSTGNALNGGGYDTAAATTDYSNQDTAQLSLSDLTNSGIGVVDVTSTMGGFTAAMVGNYLQIASGTNDTPGFYRIVSYASTNAVALDRAPDNGAGAMTSGVCKIGGALATLVDSHLEGTNWMIAGNTIYVKGSITTTGNLVVDNDGTQAARITIEGYQTTRGDAPTGASRGTIAFGAFVPSFDNYWGLKHFIATTTYTTGLRADSGALFENVKVTNSSGTANRNALYTSSVAVTCECISTNGDAAFISTGGELRYCNLHDSAQGLEMVGVDYAKIIGCVFDTITNQGMYGTSVTQQWSVDDCDFYNCGTAIDVVAGSRNMSIVNCIFDSNTVGIDFADAQEPQILNCCFNNNGTDVINVTLGENAVEADPLMTDPANGDFTISAASPCHGTGLAPGTNVGLVGTYNKNIGADQTTYGGSTAHQTRLETIC